MQEEKPTKVQRRELLRLRMEGKRSYRLIKGIARWMDRYFLDPILGFIPAGDLISAGLILPYLYVAIFQVRSLPLTLALLCNVLLDVAMGLIPFWIGDVLDFFHRSYTKNYELIVGFVEGDEAMIKRVNKRAIWMALLLILLCVLIYFLFWAAGWFFNAVIGFISSLF
ncbi:MAG: DUF4112 domain-containing protein [Bacteroidaceae bacterium]|nr:DUF4112 domain-containing protein [Bacteroidaceae bacterium]